MRWRTLVSLFRKELISLFRDTVLLAFLIYTFTLSVYIESGRKVELTNASIAIVDEDGSILSRRIAGAFLPPHFQTPVQIGLGAADRAMDTALYTFVLDIPSRFEADVVGGRNPTVQLLVDATAMVQAGVGAGYIQSIMSAEVARFLTGRSDSTTAPINLEIRTAFNQSLESSWFVGNMALIENITMLAVLLAGSALLREREHGTLEHLLVMPVRPSEIMISKVLANGFVVLVLSILCVEIVIRRIIGAQIAGSVPLLVLGTTTYLFFATSLGIFLGTVSRSMPQLSLLFILIILPMILLSGGNTPLESMPIALQYIMQLSPSTHFTAFSQAVLFRGAGLDIVWPQLAATLAIGAAFFAFSLMRFRSFLAAQG